MIVITEAQPAALVTHELAFDAVRRAFIAAIGLNAFSFPVVIAHASDPQNRFTVKMAAGTDLAGLKVGAYFPTNDARGLPRHASTILLIDQPSGRIGAVVEGSTLNCYRTAAADAVATYALARRDAAVLTVFGTGHQAGYEAEAIARIRPLSRIWVVGRDPSRAAAFAKTLQGRGLPAANREPEAAVRAADIIVTATTATAPFVTRIGCSRVPTSRPWGRIRRASRNCPRYFSPAHGYSVICRINRPASASFSMWPPAPS